MKLTDSLPREVSWVTRTIGWGFGLSVCLGLLYGFGNFKLARHMEECLAQPAPPKEATTALVEAQQFAACVDARAGPERILFSSKRKLLASLPNAPCRYVGTWAASRGAVTYKVTLAQDGQFIAAPLENAPRDAETITGSWGFANKKMIWLYDNGHFWPPDANPIKDESDGAFTLVEVNGSTTRYVLLDREGAESCRP